MEAMENADSETRLLGLVRVAFRIERTVMRHCQHEAERQRALAQVHALIAIAKHAEHTLDLLPAVCGRDDLPLHQDEPELGVLAELRERVSELLLQDYHATLSNLHHGVDVMRDVWSSASATYKPALAEFCAAWLTTRTSLLERAQAELRRVEEGFAMHPLTRATGLRGASNVGEDETSGSE
jgi:hypothetical protein